MSYFRRLPSGVRLLLSASVESLIRVDVNLFDKSMYIIRYGGSALTRVLLSEFRKLGPVLSWSPGYVYLTIEAGRKKLLLQMREILLAEQSSESDFIANVEYYLVYHGRAAWMREFRDTSIAALCPSAGRIHMRVVLALRNTDPDALEYLLSIGYEITIYGMESASAIVRQSFSPDWTPEEVDIEMQNHEQQLLQIIEPLRERYPSQVSERVIEYLRN